MTAWSLNLSREVIVVGATDVAYEELAPELGQGLWTFTGDPESQ